MFDAETLTPRGDVPVGEHPNAMVLSKDGARLFVACANTNAVWVVDLATRTAKEQISVALYPEGARRDDAEQPVAVARRHDAARRQRRQQHRGDRRRLEAGRERGRGLGARRAGIRPACCSIATGARFFVLAGKGLTSAANPAARSPAARAIDGQYTGNMFQGAISVVPLPDAATRAAWTKRVYALTPYTDARRLAPPEAPRAQPIPAPRRRDLADQVRVLRHPREPHLRSDPRRPAAGQRRSVADALRRGGDAERPRARARVRAVRQLLRRRRGQLRRPRVLDRRVRDRRRREAVADQLRQPRRAVPERRRVHHPQRRTATSRRRRRATSGTSPSARASPFAATASSPGGRRRGGEVKASVPGLEGLVHPSYPPFDLSIPDEQRIDIWLTEFLELESDGRAAAALDHPPRRRSHQRDVARLAARRAR